jgi:hypothetical protein
LDNNSGRLEDYENNIEAKNEFIQNNINIILEALFPTRFHVIKQNYNSFDIVTGRDGIQNMIFNPLNLPSYSYLNINGAKKITIHQGGAEQKVKEQKIDTSNIFTVNKVIWLNDILNHPEYKKIISKYIVFNDWLVAEQAKYESKYNQIKRSKTKSDKLTNEEAEIVEIMELKTQIPKSPSNKKIKEFFNFLKDYRDKKISSNASLQNILSISKEDRDSSKVVRFFKFMEYVYTHFILLKEQQTDSLIDENMSSLLNVGYMSNRIMDDNDNNSHIQLEIVVMIDVVQGAITKENASSIYCPYISEYLGNELTHLIEKPPSLKYRDDWAVDKYRTIFSADTKVSEEIDTDGIVLKPVAVKIDESTKAKDEREISNEMINYYREILVNFMNSDEPEIQKYKKNILSELSNSLNINIEKDKIIATKLFDPNLNISSSDMSKIILLFPDLFDALKQIYNYEKKNKDIKNPNNLYKIIITYSEAIKPFLYREYRDYIYEKDNNSKKKIFNKIKMYEYLRVIIEYIISNIDEIKDEHNKKQKRGGKLRKKNTKKKRVAKYSITKRNYNNTRNNL